MAQVLESPHDGCFTVFIKIKISRFYPHIFKLDILYLLFVHSSSESSKTPYRFAPLNISVVLFFILCIALSYVVLGISFIVLSVIVLLVIVLLVIVLSVNSIVSQ